MATDAIDAAAGEPRYVPGLDNASRLLCFANSVLQALAVATPFREHVQHLSDGGNGSSATLHAPLAQLARLLDALAAGSARPAPALAAHVPLVYELSRLARGQQHDAEEFLRAVQSSTDGALHDAQLARAARPPQAPPGLLAGGAPARRRDCRARPHAQPPGARAPLACPFTLCVGERIQCLGAHAAARRAWRGEPSKLLALNASELGAARRAGAGGRHLTDLEKLLALELSAARLPDDYRCGCAGGRVEHACVKERALLQPPRVLAVHVNRVGLAAFSGSRTTRARGALSFPGVLNLAPFVLRPAMPAATAVASAAAADASGAGPSGGGGGGGALPYTLVALVEHAGDVDAGHYVAYRRVRAPASGPLGGVAPPPPPHRAAWVCASDAAVRAVDWAHVARAEAYLLFYARCDGGAAEAAAGSDDSEES